MNKVVEKLIQNNITISTAESCTGGLIASQITKHAGVSAIYPGSVVSYSNEIKHKLLGVSEDIFLKYGAVSEECVEEMLVGLEKLMQTDICIAVSGIAGPDGGTKEKPVGLVFIGIKYKDILKIEKNIFKGSRVEVQNQAMEKSFEMIKELDLGI